MWISDTILKRFFKTEGDFVPLFFSKIELGNYISEQMNHFEDHENVDSEIQIFQNALEFSNVRAREAMIPRAEIISVDRYVKPSELDQIFIKSGLSKILIHRENIDNVVGYISLMDMFKDYKNFKPIIHPVEYIPESMFVNDLLNLLTKKRKRIAVVIDEYGGTSGIVTLEDVLEEIVGEINDEFDVDDNIYSKLDANNFIFEGKISLIDFLKIIKGENDYFDDLKGESDSLAGLILEVKGQIPKIGEVCEIPPYTMVVESADLRRIKRLKITIDEN